MYPFSRAQRGATGSDLARSLLTIMTKTSAQAIFDEATSEAASDVLIAPGYAGIQVLLEAHDTQVTVDEIAEIYAKFGWDASKNLAKI